MRACVVRVVACMCGACGVRVVVRACVRVVWRVLCSPVLIVPSALTLTISIKKLYQLFYLGINYK